MGWKKSEEKTTSVPEDKIKEKGEGIKPPIVLKNNETVEGIDRGTSFHINNEPEKKSSGWQKKFLGIPVWGWVILGLVLVWAGISVGIVAGH